MRILILVIMVFVLSSPAFCKATWGKAAFQKDLKAKSNIKKLFVYDMGGKGQTHKLRAAEKRRVK